MLYSIKKLFKTLVILEGGNTFKCLQHYLYYSHRCYFSNKYFLFLITQVLQSYGTYSKLNDSNTNKSIKIRAKTTAEWKTMIYVTRFLSCTSAILVLETVWKYSNLYLKIKIDFLEICEQDFSKNVEPLSSSQENFFEISKTYAGIYNYKYDHLPSKILFQADKSK